MCDYATRFRYPLDESFNLLGKRWAVPILLEILSGKDTFNVLLKTIPGVNSKTLSARLSDLVKCGIIAKRTSTLNRRMTSYELTSKGENFRFIIRELVGFSIRWDTDAQSVSVQA